MSKRRKHQCTEVRPCWTGNSNQKLQKSKNGKIEFGAKKINCKSTVIRIPEDERKAATYLQERMLHKAKDADRECEDKISW